MANVIYNEGKKRILGALAGSVNLSALKGMLVKTTYVANPDHAAIDDGTAADPKSHELVATGYARQSLTGLTTGKDTVTDFGYFDADDVAFGALAAGDTIGGMVVFLDTGLDTTSVPIAFYDTVDTPTNGSAITIQFAAIGSGGVLKAS